MLQNYFLMPSSSKTSGILDAWKGTKCQDPETPLLSTLPVQDNKHSGSLKDCLLMILFKKAFGLRTGHSQTQEFGENLDKQCTGVPEAPFRMSSSV